MLVKKFYTILPWLFLDALGGVLSQVSNKFIFAVVDDLLVVVDQHAADERRRLELLQTGLSQLLLKKKLHPSKRLRVTPTEWEAAQLYQSILVKWNFQVAAIDRSFSVGNADIMSDSEPAASPEPSLETLSDGHWLELQTAPVLCGVDFSVEDLRDFLGTHNFTLC